MAKLFKVIMNILIILFIASLVALFVPPLLGITTVISEPDTASNMQIGSVAYGTRVPLDEISKGDTIISSSDNETYLYTVEDIDASTGVLSVKSSETADAKEITLRRTASKKLFVIPLIGYIVIAFQSTEGLIILGLGVALLVILFIISEILCKKSKKSDEDDDEAAVDREYFRDLATSQQKPSSLDELATITIPPIKDILEEEKKAEADTAALDEDFENPELILEPVSNDDEASIEEFAEENEKGDTEASDAAKPADIKDNSSADISSSDKAGTAASSKDAHGKKDSFKADNDIQSSVQPSKPSESASSQLGSTSELSDIESALESVLENEQMNPTPHSEQPAAAPEAPVSEPASSEIEIAIPAKTLEELLQEAYAKGEDPTVIKDESAGVTLVDYSDCLK
ncbi:MAG: hypothetical protein MR372_01775 [Lachnospiraceae bacterium]|nr:hypothetical protein [Lachnospiraceae bacterium]MDY6221768.1 hypothetical protein [Candidatus Alectryocaccobium sp.]